MLNIVLLGVNHKTAPVQLRECLAFSKNESVAAIETLQRCPAISEVMIISTCNRVEVLMATVNMPEAVSSAKTYIAEVKNLPASRFEKSFYLHEGDRAVQHIFRVASSLDSMIVGEPQILGQIKEAYSAATQKKTTGVILNRLMHKTFSVAKRVRSETGIGDHAVSISYAAIELGRKIFGSLEGKEVLLIGADEMAELAVQHLIRNRVGSISVANRTFKRGAELAKHFNGKAIRLEEIPEYLKFVDIIISSTGSSDFIIKPDQIKGVMRKRRNRPIFFIDIAVPRDIDPEINRIANSYVYDIDDLKGIIDGNIEERNQESLKGERIIEEAVITFKQWYESLDVVPTIVGLRNKFEAIADAEIIKSIQSLKHLSDEDCKVIYKMTNGIINKILHDPTIFLKRNGCRRDKQVYLDITRKLFKLDE